MLRSLTTTLAISLLCLTGCDAPLADADSAAHSDNAALCAAAIDHVETCTGTTERVLSATCDPVDAELLLATPCDVLQEAQGVTIDEKYDGVDVSFACSVLGIGCPVDDSCMPKVSDEAVAKLIVLSNPDTLMDAYDARHRIAQIADIFTPGTEGQPGEGSQPLVTYEQGSVGQGSWMHFGPYVAGAGSFRVEMVGNGDADLYVRKGAQPTPAEYDCSPFFEGSEESCSVEGPGEFYVSVSGFKASNFNLTITHSAPGALAPSVTQQIEHVADPIGMFAIVYRHITNNGMAASEAGEYENVDWVRNLITAFAKRYLENLHGYLTGGEVTPQWQKYYKLARNCKVDRSRVLGVAIATHLLVDMTYALYDVGSTKEHEEDYIRFGEISLNVFPDIIGDTYAVYGEDVEPLLTGFFFGDWVDGWKGKGSFTTFLYQAVRLNAWRNCLNLYSWPRWMVDADVVSGWGMAEVSLAAIDAAGGL